MNARSLKTVTSNVNKVRDFSALLELCQGDIVAVTETWLSSNITDGELFSDDYVTYRNGVRSTARECKKCFYSVLQATPSFNRDIFCKALDDTLQRVHKEYENVCVLGDFNFPEIPWLNDNTCHHNFSSFIEDFGHVQFNNIKSNCKGNVIY